MPKPITQNTLFYGDNLPILRGQDSIKCEFGEAVIRL